MKKLMYANRAEPKSISVISILLLAAAGDITKLRCMHRECYIFSSQNLCIQYYKFTKSYKQFYGSSNCALISKLLTRYHNCESAKNNNNKM